MKRRTFFAPVFAGLLVAAVASSSPGCSSDSCDVPADCGTNTPCKTYLCIDSQCQTNLEAAGTPLPDTDIGDCSRPICASDGDMTLVIEPNDPESDGLDCTTDTCTSEGATVHDLMGEGAPCSQNGGDVCDPSGKCVACALVNPDCSLPDPGEPNETQDTADDQGSLTDNDGDGKTFCAALKGEGDVDWFTYSGTDVVFAEVDPTRGVNAQKLARVCAFLECTLGTPDVLCPSDTLSDTAPNGAPGCCSEPLPSTLEPFSISFDCVGTGDDDATVWISVANMSGEACVPYKLTYHY